jgi:hypothetical protein
LNAIISLLSKNRRYLEPQQVGTVLSAINSMGDAPFKLSDLDPLLPDEIRANKRARRSITSLLNLLANIGYLSRPSQRTYQKRFNSLSQMLSASLFELAEIEKGTAKPVRSERIIKLRPEDKPLGPILPRRKPAGKAR